MVTSWPPCGELLGDEGADVAASDDDDLHRVTSGPAAGEVRVELGDLVRAHGHVHDVALLGDEVGGRHLADARGGTARPPGRGRARRDRPADARPSSARPAARRAPRWRDGSVHSGGGRVGQDAAQHAVGGPLHGGDGGDAELLVDRRPAGVVDAGDHPLQAEDLAGGAGHHDVGVVAAGDGGQRAGLLDAGRAQVIAVEPDALDRAAREPLGQAAEGLGLLVDDGDRVATVLQDAGEPGTDPAASDDDDVQRALLFPMDRGAWRASTAESYDRRTRASDNPRGLELLRRCEEVADLDEQLRLGGRHVLGSGSPAARRAAMRLHRLDDDEEHARRRWTRSG